MTIQEALVKLKRDLEFRGRSPNTIRDYCFRARLFMEYFNKSPNELDEEDVIEYLHYLLTVEKLSKGSVNGYNSAVRFLLGVTLEKLMNYKKIPRIKFNRKLPQLFTKDEVRNIIESTKNLRHKVWFMLAYGSGLRVSEIINLKITDIESSQMRIFIRSGKGNKDRYTILPQETLEALRNYWRMYRPKEWLFESPRMHKDKITCRAVSDAFQEALKRAGITKSGSIHRLRHCFATHLLDEENSLYAIKKLLGHVRIDTTVWYAQLSNSKVFSVKSPIDGYGE